MNSWHSELWLHFQPLGQEQPQPLLCWQRDMGTGCACLGAPSSTQSRIPVSGGAAARRGGSARSRAACAHQLLAMAALPASSTHGGEPSWGTARGSLGLEQAPVPPAAHSGRGVEVKCQLRFGVSSLSGVSDLCGCGGPVLSQPLGDGGRGGKHLALVFGRNNIHSLRVSGCP